MLSETGNQLELVAWPATLLVVGRHAPEWRFICSPRLAHRLDDFFVCSPSISSADPFSKLALQERKETISSLTTHRSPTCLSLKGSLAFALSPTATKARNERRRRLAAHGSRVLRCC